MKRERHIAPDTPGLQTCEGCGQPFVVPVDLLDLVDEGLYLLALHCKNCDRLAVGVHEDAELEQLECGNEVAEAQIVAALQAIEAARSVEDLGAL